MSDDTPTPDESEPPGTSTPLEPPEDDAPLPEPPPLLDEGDSTPAFDHRSTRRGDTGGSHVGRVPPYNLDAEASLLGAMLLSRDAIADALEIIEVDHFYKPSHGHVYDAICTLYASGDPADPVTVSEMLTRAGVLDQIGGPGFLLELQAATPATSSAAKYARIIQENATPRSLIGVANEIAEIGYGRPDDVVKAVDEAENMVFQVGQGRVADTMSKMSDLLNANLDQLEKRYEEGKPITGTPTGFVDFDLMLSGLQPSNLVIIGARPAMGKTSFALNIATSVAMKAGLPVLMFSLEMSQLELSQRILCSESRVDSKNVRSGNLREEDWSRINHGVGRLADAPLWIDDNPSTSVMEIRAKARRLTSRVGKLGVVIVDYLQLMTGRTRAESRQVEVSEISRGLKILARELDTPVIGLSQLSRALESRQDKRPMLADLRESGSLEQDADVVAFIYRDEVYNTESPDIGTAEIIVAKHRNGPTGTTRLAFVPHHTRFADMAQTG